jgi:hypothetical protein
MSRATGGGYQAPGAAGGGYANRQTQQLRNSINQGMSNITSAAQQGAQQGMDNFSQSVRNAPNIDSAATQYGSASGEAGQIQANAAAAANDEIAKISADPQLGLGADAYDPSATGGAGVGAADPNPISGSGADTPSPDSQNSPNRKLGDPHAADSLAPITRSACEAMRPRADIIQLPEARAYCVLEVDTPEPTNEWHYLVEDAQPADGKDGKFHIKTHDSAASGVRG